MGNSIPPLNHVGIILYIHQFAEMALDETVAEIHPEFPARLCREITVSTQGRVELLLIKPTDLRLPQFTPDTEKHMIFVQYGRRIYGTLVFSFSQEEPSLRLQELDGMRLMAKTCADILHDFMSSFVISHSSPLPDRLTVASLTPRQREALQLHCQGYDVPEIARQLQITEETAGKHKKEVYDKLGAKNKLDTLLIAFRIGLFSPLPYVQINSD